MTENEMQVLVETEDENGESRPCPTLVHVDPEDLIPAPENSRVYRPVDPDDPAIQSLADDIAKRGILEPLVITLDNHILSGHRRRAAAILADLPSVPCRVENIYSSDPEFLDKLVAYNTQRVKNHTELLHESVVKADPEEAYEALIEHRRKQAVVKTETITVAIRGPRKRIGQLKADLVDAIVTIVRDLEDYWPLSDRHIHYLLLNVRPRCNRNRPGSRYQNKLKCYKDLCNLLVRMRLAGSIPMECIADETRPTVKWRVHDNVQDFARQEFDDFLKGFRRDLQQTQPLHIEIVAEKLTLKSIIRPVCAKYNIPYVIGRGYSSLPSRWEVVKRFRRSGKEKLCLVVLGDLDPEGIDINESLLQSMREDFGLYDFVVAVRAGLNPEHIQRFHLSENTSEAKSGSSRYAKFVQRFGRRVYELEALQPEQLQEILSEAIDNVIDKSLFNIELDAEKRDAASLAAVRNRVCEYLRDDCLTWLDDED